MSRKESISNSAYVFPPHMPLIVRYRIVLLRIYFQLYLCVRAKKIHIHTQSQDGNCLSTYVVMLITLVVVTKCNMLRKNVLRKIPRWCGMVYWESLP